MNKVTIPIIAAAIVIIVAIACVFVMGNTNDDNGQDDTPNVPAKESNVLVAYFSKTGTTEGYAERIADILDADIFEIVTVYPYPEDYTETTQIAQQEKNNGARPTVSTRIDDMSGYDTIILGYPIWWSAPPMAVLTFLESYDLTGKDVVTFCTSGGTGIGVTTSFIEESATGADIVEGIRMTSGTDITSWLQELGLTI